MVLINELYDGYNVFTFNTITGKIWASVPVSSSQWSLKINAPGNISCGIPINSEELEGLDINTGTLENRMSLGVSFKENIIEAGPILDRNYDSDTEVLEIQAEGLWSLFNARKVLPPWAQVPGAQKITSAVQTFSNQSLRSIARGLARLGEEGPPNGSGQLPIWYTVGVESGAFTKSYNGFDLKWVGKVLTELTEEEDGPDLRFRPRFRSDNPTFVEWVFEAGTPLLRQAGPNWKWDGTTPGTGVVGFSAASDGRNMAARAWRPGQGQEQDVPLGVHTDMTMVNLGWPWMERDTASKQEADVATLNAYARQDVQDSAGPEKSFNISVDANSSPVLGTYWPGDWADVIVPQGHPILPAGEVTVRIMGIDGDDSEKVKITVAPVIGDLSGSQYPASITIGEDTTPLAPYPAEQQYPSYYLFPADESELEEA